MNLTSDELPSPVKNEEQHRTLEKSYHRTDILQVLE